MKTCIVCGVVMPESRYDTCMAHIPKNGAALFLGSTVVFYGHMSVAGLLMAKAFGKRVIRWWVGTDVLTLHSFPPGISKFRVILHRVKTWLLNPLVDEHWAFGEGLAHELRPHVMRNTGLIRSVISPPDHLGIERKPFRDGALVVGFYRPTTKHEKFNRWKYGIDLVEEAANELWYDRACRRVLFLPISGNREEIGASLRTIDCYIRPSRHEGYPRIVMACQELGIPYYYREDFKPDLVDLIQFIQEQRVKKCQKMGE